MQGVEVEIDSPLTSYVPCQQAGLLVCPFSILAGSTVVLDWSYHVMDNRQPVKGHGWHGAVSTLGRQH